jgi:hypothetical protein
MTDIQNQTLVELVKTAKWTPEQISKLEELAKANTPTGLIASELGKDKDAIFNKAQELHISLKPVNQSPYNRE